MPDDLPPAYCFFQDIAPRPPLDAVFDRDYLLYAQYGALRVTVGQQKWLLPSSFAAWVPANTPLWVELARPVTTCSVLVTPGFCPLMPRAPVVLQMSDMTRLMIHHCREWGPKDAHPPEAQGFFLSLLNACARLASVSVDVKRPQAQDPTIARAIDITADRLATRVTASEVAKAANLSERSMQRKFAQEVGMTWAQVLTRLRMIRALELLAAEDAPIIQVAAECGFASLSAFNRAFLDFAQRTPSAFRKDVRSNPR